MKKLIACLLLLCLILPVCYAEDLDETQYIGTWVYTKETANGGLTLEVMYLTEDHRVFYVYQTFDAEKSTYTQRHTGSWAPWESGDGINIEIGEGYLSLTGVYRKNSGLGLRHKSGADYKLFVALALDMLRRTANAVPVETGVFVPGGYWEVGVDIPAGTYSVRRAENIRSQNFVVYQAYNEESERYTRTVINTILNESNPQIGKFTLREGNVVWVDEGVYFDKPITLGF
jgi:hypothetical protein